MSLPREQIAAQEGAFHHPESQWWHRHLLTPGQLEYHMEMARRAEGYEQALRLIAAPMREDGSFNRSRESCQQIAQKALDIGPHLE